MTFLKILVNVERGNENLEFPENLESYFQELTDITDQIAMMNHHFDAKPGENIEKMLSFTENLRSLEWESKEKEYYELFSSYYTFHLKIVEEIIAESREEWQEENKTHVKNLVQYLKKAEDWYSALKKKKKPEKSVA